MSRKKTSKHQQQELIGQSSDIGKALGHLCSYVIRYTSQLEARVSNLEQLVQKLEAENDPHVRAGFD